MKVIERYDWKPYFLSDRDVLMIRAIANRIADGDSIGDYQSAAFSMLAKFLFERMKEMDEELK